MDLSNASMYDGSTATAEAMMMCVAAAKKRNRVLISATVNPAVRAVVKTYAKFHGVDLVEVPAAGGTTDRAEVSRLLAEENVAGVIVALAGGSLFTVAISASAVVYVLLLIL